MAAAYPGCPLTGRSRPRTGAHPSRSRRLRRGSGPARSCRPAQATLRDRPRTCVRHKCHSDAVVASCVGPAFREWHGTGGGLGSAVADRPPPGAAAGPAGLNQSCPDKGRSAPPDGNRRVRLQASTGILACPLSKRPGSSGVAELESRPGPAVSLSCCLSAAGIRFLGILSRQGWPGIRQTAPKHNPSRTGRAGWSRSARWRVQWARHRCCSAARTPSDPWPSSPHPLLRPPRGWDRTGR